MKYGKCHDCHFFKEERAREIMSNGKIYPCSNIGVDGWDYWNDHQCPPTRCHDYCKRGEYVPTGMWAELAGIINKIGEMADKEK